MMLTARPMRMMTSRSWYGSAARSMAGPSSPAVTISTTLSELFSAWAVMAGHRLRVQTVTHPKGMPMRKAKKTWAGLMWMRPNTSAETTMLRQGVKPWL